MGHPAVSARFREFWKYNRIHYMIGKMEIRREKNSENEFN